MTSGPYSDVTLVLLAGGQGRRLGGVPKALIQVEGRTILERFDELSPRFADALVVANDAAPYRSTRARIVPDVRPGFGAPGGLHAALTEARTPWVVLLASDMPFVTEAVIGALLARRAPGRTWICTVRDGWMNPMPGVYARDLLSELDRRLSGNPSFRDVLEQVPGHAVPSEELLGVDPALRYLDGINTPEEAERLSAVLPSGRT